MTKQELGKQIETLRKECGVSTYELEQKGIHPSLPATIEKGQKGYDMAISQLGNTEEAIELREYLIKERNRMLKSKARECLKADELAEME